MRVRLQHRTRYRFAEPALIGPHLVRLRPAAHARARLLSYNLEVLPEPSVRWQQDPAGNRIARITYPAGAKVNELSIRVDLAVDVRPVNPFDFFVEEHAKEVPFRYEPDLAHELAAYIDPEVELGPRTREFERSLPQSGYVTDWLVALDQQVAHEVRYVIRNEVGIQTSEETLQKGLGSCRDSAKLLVDLLRARGLAARFVSGYLIQLEDEGDIPGLARGVNKDVVDLHAWAEVFVPGAGWVGLDGTSGLLCGEGHIPLACTADPLHAAPIEGTTSAPSTLDFEMQVERLGKEPTPRRPYSVEQWNALLACGTHVDAALASAGIALTMGGEPTWVSRIDRTSKEWSTEALGPSKWKQGLAFAEEIRKRFAPGGIAMQRMGKHYPGESLPRWVLHLVWRKDGQPIWHDESRLVFGSKDVSKVASDVRPEAMLRAVARRLGLSAAPVAGFEDPWVHIRQEQDLPLDVDPRKADLSDSEERRRLARVLERGLSNPVGFALPIGRDGAHWVSSEWTFRREAMFLVPGDSPMGLRLPLDRLNGSIPFLPERDPSTIDEREFHVRSQYPDTNENRSSPPVEGTLRTALCAEIRDGVLHLFLPPLPRAEDWLELILTIEDAAVELGTRIALEGYPPPSDHRLQHCLVTPDPGVLEVNIPVTDRFSDYAAQMETLADAARHAELTTIRFQLDGRETGTGGGHHLTLGGPTPLDSPWLRRPDLLASMLRYVQGHPSLSYLFTGLFVGPTSQAPRLDEARHDALYELEIALDRVPRPGSGDRPIPPWLVDRLFRNLLVDVSGNTHRTEICIDKLWDPLSAAGRQGLLEFRAFEMPPHERMAVAQMLLVRGLVAKFAKEPWEKPLVRWGSELHDRFMLPHYLFHDLESVLEDLRHSGFAFDREWYRPFVELRCPLLGEVSVDDIRIELRAAIEPWPVLGEEGVPGGTARHVDSSLERLEIKVFGMVEGRHVAAVNGLRLPMRSTGTVSERVCGVRFRAWQPPYSLQPTIGVHHPLRFDVIDTWAKRSVVSCTHHVWHPEGRAYTEPPITLEDAAARRAQRFVTTGHSPWPAIAHETRVHPDQPYSLDLRRYPVDRRIPGSF